MHEDRYPSFHDDRPEQMQGDLQCLDLIPCAIVSCTRWTDQGVWHSADPYAVYRWIVAIADLGRVVLHWLARPPRAAARRAHQEERPAGAVGHE